MPWPVAISTLRAWEGRQACLGLYGQQWTEMDFYKTNKILKIPISASHSKRPNSSQEPQFSRLSKEKAQNHTFSDNSVANIAISRVCLWHLQSHAILQGET